jgi:hypothetical protein
MKGQETEFAFGNSISIIRGYDFVPAVPSFLQLPLIIF